MKYFGRFILIMKNHATLSAFTGEDLYRLMINNISESFVFADKNLRIVESNKAAQQTIWNQLGIALKPGIYLLDLAEERIKPQLLQLYTDALNGIPVKTDIVCNTLNGFATHFENNILPARNEEGEIVGVIIYSKEITEKKQAESDLREAEERWQFAFEASNQAAWDWNMQTNEIIYSSSYKKMYGFSGDDLKNDVNEWLSRIHPDDKQKIDKDLEKHSTSDNPYYETTYRIQLKNGDYKWIMARGKILSKDSEGNPMRMIGTHTDLTKTLNAKAEIKKMNDRFLYAAKASSQALWEWDALTGEAYVSPTFTELFGWQADTDRRFEQWHQYVHPDDRRQTVDGYYLCLQNIEKNIWQAEYRFLKADGSYATVSDKAYILRDTENKVIKVIGATEDITSKKKTEEELYKTNERFDIMMKATNELLWEWDIRNNFIYRAQQGLQKVYGIADDSNIKTLEKWLERIHPDDHKKLDEIIEDIKNATDHYTFEIEYRFKKDDGHYTFVYDRGILLNDENNQPLRIIGAAQNISERKELEQELLKNELEYKKLINQATVDSQEQERSEIGRELHDNINQVLTTTKLYLELALANKNMTTELIKKSSRNISSLITEIRELSRSLMDPTIGDLGIIDSINDLVDNINLARKVHINLEIDETIENCLDKNQKLTIFRILQESLNNVIKHAKATFVQIYITREEDYIEMVINDDGIGFEHESVKKGAGLKNITNRIYLINGSFIIDTEPGRGCIIKINFPIQKLNKYQ
jgi:PAS domain S-box-containing protein